MKTVCVIGGGAAGMMASYSASLNENARVFLFEKNERLGRKLLITGKGRCNITNMGDLDDFMENIPHNGSFLFSAFSSFNNYDLIALLNERGLKTKVERGMRVFPESDKASDVVEFFVSLLKRENISVNYGKSVKTVKYCKERNGFEIFSDDGGKYISDTVVLATGGLSYPQTGSTGDGYRIAKSLGHSVTKLYPSLTGLKTEEDYGGVLAGLSLKNIAVTIEDSERKKVYRDFGELVFTHTGVSGPVILSGSARITRRVGAEAFKMYIDLKPALDEKKLDMRLLRDFNKNKNRDLVNSLDDLLPKSIIPVIIREAGISPRKKTNEITRVERTELIRALKAFPMTITGTDGFNNAVITGGGVNINEINPKTMESKIIKGLYLAGEMIDVDAYTGGFNLQIAFSTGYLAGRQAAAE